jgi:UDP-N-acetylmuramate dehydrogenase
MEILRDIEILKRHTTLKTGGVARYFVEVREEGEVVAAVRQAEPDALPPLILGGGSNMLVTEDLYEKLVMKNSLKGTSYTDRDEGQVLLGVASGEVLDEVVAETVERGYWGLENLSSIPGTVGATPVQNVGAYGVEVSQLIESVESIDIRSGEKKIF